MPERGAQLVFLAFFAESEENMNPSTTEFLQRLVMLLDEAEAPERERQRKREEVIQEAKAALQEKLKRLLGDDLWEQLSPKILFSTTLGVPEAAFHFLAQDWVLYHFSRWQWSLGYPKAFENVADHQLREQLLLALARHERAVKEQQQQDEAQQQAEAEKQARLDEQKLEAQREAEEEKQEALRTHERILAELADEVARKRKALVGWPASLAQATIYRLSYTRGTVFLPEIGQHMVDRVTHYTTMAAPDAQGYVALQMPDGSVEWLKLDPGIHDLQWHPCVITAETIPDDLCQIVTAQIAGVGWEWNRQTRSYLLVRSDFDDFDEDETSQEVRPVGIEPVAWLGQFLQTLAN
jgi:hypothetical protein